MPTNQIILESINSDGLKDLIKVAVREELAAIPPKKENNYLTRSDMSKKLHVSLPTVDKMIGNGKLKAVRLGGRILFKEDELSLEEIPVRKYRR
jgi:excisionase family DNA binding protein